MNEKPMDSWRARAAVSEAIDVFNSTYMQEIWSKALARRQLDPEGAVTSARTLLESVCKHILTSANQPYKVGTSLPQLYKLAAAQLELAPDEHTAEIFTSLFETCTKLVEGIGNLRNHLSDSHGRGPFGTMPDWRHAELAVNLSAAIATYLAAVWAGRQPTVSNVINSFIAEADATEPLGESHRYALDSFTRSPIGEVIAAKLQVGDVQIYWDSRIAKGVSPRSILVEISYLRGALGDPSEDVISRAIQIIRDGNDVGKYVPLERRVTDEEIHEFLEILREPAKIKASNLIGNMPEFVEFALWSGRTRKEIGSLRWEDVNFDDKSCKLPYDKKPFPLLERAWEIVELLRPQAVSRNEVNIFPFNSLKSSTAKFRGARAVIRKRLGEDWGKGLTFHGLRYEAVCRLLEKGHPPHIVARATGQNITKVTQIHLKLQSTFDFSGSHEDQGSGR